MEDELLKIAMIVIKNSNISQNAPKQNPIHWLLTHTSEKSLFVYHYKSQSTPPITSFLVHAFFILIQDLYIPKDLIKDKT